MPSALSHDPSISTPGASTDNAVVIFDGTGGTGFGNSTILVDSGGNGRIGISTDTNIITLTNETVTVAGTVAATTLTGSGAGITALAAANITANGTLPALNGGALTALNGTQITSGTLPAARIADDSIVEAKLDVSNAPTNGQFLQAQSGEGGGLTWAAAGISSTVESFTRTASAGAGTQALTGAGFAPKAAIIYAGDGGAGAAWGFVDDSDGGRNIYHNAQNGSMTTTIFSLSASHAINVRNNSSASDQMYASAALTSNGLTFTWSKSNSGVDVTGYILYLG